MNQLSLLALKNESNKKEALFSSISHVIHNSGLVVNIFTDDLQWFLNKLDSFSEFKSSIIIHPCPDNIFIPEKNSFTYKLGFILSQYKEKEKFIYCDTDTFSFAKWKQDVFDETIIYFSKFEYDVMKCRHLKDKHIKTFVIPFLKKNSPDYKGRYLMYNSGFLSIPVNKRKEIENANVLSGILYERFPMFHQMEQLSLSFYLGENQPLTADSFLCHYWAVKNEMHKQIDRLNFNINLIKEWLLETATIVQKKQLKAENRYFNPTLTMKLIHQYKLARKNFHLWVFKNYYLYGN